MTDESASSTPVCFVPSSLASFLLFSSTLNSLKSLPCSISPLFSDVLSPPEQKEESRPQIELVSNMRLDNKGEVLVDSC